VGSSKSMATGEIRLVVRGYVDGIYFCPSPMPTEKPLLKIRITGPAIKPGRIPIPLLVDICNETQKAVNREAQALEGRRSLHPGPPIKEVTKECTLELVGIKKGSTTLNFVSQNDQGVLGDLTMRTAAIDGVAKALKSVGTKRGQSELIDFGLLDALDRLGDVLDKGVSKLQLIVPHHNGRKTNLIADLTPTIRPKIKARLQPSFSDIGPQKAEDLSFVEGTVEITEGRGRITPLVGESTTFNFDQKQADNVYGARHKPVKAKVDPKTHKLRDIELASFPGKGDFFALKTIQQLIEEQGVKPIDDLDAFATLSNDEVESLIAEIHHGRMA
jgi:hypothetical protein